jgi:integrase
VKSRGVYENPKGSKVWWICFFDGQGKRRREKVGTPAAAKKLYEQRKAEVKAGTYNPGRRATGVGVTFGELLDDVVKYVNDPHHKRKSAKDYRIKAEIIRPAFGYREASSITDKEIEKWLAKRCKTAATFNRYRSFFMLVFRLGIKNRDLTANPAKTVEHRKEPSGRVGYLTREQYQMLRDRLTEDYPENVHEFVFAVHTGMRAGEQYGMQWRQVRTDTKTGRMWVELEETKNDRPRTVHLNQAARDAIDAVRPERFKLTDPVFPRNDVKAIDNRWWFKSSLEEIGISTEGPKKFTWHNLRHTFCSWLAMAGATNREIMEAAGHRTLQMAARYSHLSPAHTASVVDRLVE